MSMFGGVLHGFLAGGVLGPLSNLDGSVGEVSAITLAAWGCIIDALGLSILYGCLMVVLTFTMFPHDKSERWMVTIKRDYQTSAIVAVLTCLGDRSYPANPCSN